LPEELRETDPHETGGGVAEETAAGELVECLHEFRDEGS